MESTEILQMIRPLLNTTLESCLFIYKLALN